MRDGDDWRVLLFMALVAFIFVLGVVLSGNESSGGGGDNPSNCVGSQVFC